MNNNILYQTLWSYDEMFTQLAYQQEGGVLDASVQKMSIVERTSRALCTGCLLEWPA